MSICAAARVFAESLIGASAGTHDGHSGTAGKCERHGIQSLYRWRRRCICSGGEKTFEKMATQSNHEVQRW